MCFHLDTGKNASHAEEMFMSIIFGKQVLSEKKGEGAKF